MSFLLTADGVKHPQRRALQFVQRAVVADHVIRAPYFLFQRPLHRWRQRLALEGLSVSQGTLTGGLQRLGELPQPLYTRILEHRRQADHGQMDETQWLVFAESAGKKGFPWWLWVVLTCLSGRQVDAMRRKLAELGITARDIEDSIAWARRPS